MPAETLVNRIQASRIAALDYGRRRLGLALSDETKGIAFPLTTLKCTVSPPECAALVARHLKAHAIQERYVLERLVIGWPLLLNGTEGDMAEA